MNPPPEFFYCVFAYLVASIPFGVIVSRLVVGKDVRKQGSGNIGATNVARLMGKKWGIVVLLLDALKGYVVVFASGWLTPTNMGSLEFANLVAVIAVWGHCYPIYLRFKGGKGVATAIGSIAALSPLIMGLSIVAFLVAVVGTRRISAGSLIGALAAPLLSVMLQTPAMPIPVAFIACIIWWKHRENLERLLQGKEPRFF